MTDATDVTTVLNDLIAVCRNGEHGYTTAAHDVKNTELETIFISYAEQRAKFAKELAAEITRLGGTPKEAGTLPGAMHRGWIDLKAALTGAAPDAILGSCETGEDSAAAAYERAVDTELPGETRKIIEEQWKKVREAHSHIERLNHRADAGLEFEKNEASDELA